MAENKVEQNIVTKFKIMPSIEVVEGWFKKVISITKKLQASAKADIKLVSPKTHPRRGEMAAAKKTYKERITAAKKYAAALKPVIVLLKKMDVEQRKAKGAPGAIASIKEIDALVLAYKGYAKQLSRAGGLTKKEIAALNKMDKAIKERVKTLKQLTNAHKKDQELQDARIKKVLLEKAARAKADAALAKAYEKDRLAMRKNLREKIKYALRDQKLTTARTAKQTQAAAVIAKEAVQVRKLTQRALEAVAAFGLFNKASKTALRELSLHSKTAAASVRRLGLRIGMMRVVMSKVATPFTLGGLYRVAIFVRSLITSFMVLGATIYGVVYAVRSFTNAAMEQRKRTATLQIVSREYGRDLSEVQRILDDVVNSGFLPLNAASKVMINLLAMKKVSMQEVEAGMWTIIAAAHSMKRGEIGVAEAAQMVSEGLRQQMSRMTDAAGEGVNIAVINKRMAASMGLVLSQLSHEERQRLSVLGYINIHGKYLENLTAKTNVHARVVNKVATAWTQFRIELGEELLPLYTRFLAATLPVIKRIRELWKVNKVWLEDAVNPLIKALPVFAIKVLKVAVSLGKLGYYFFINLLTILKWAPTILLATAALGTIGVVALLVAKKFAFLRATVALLTGDIYGFVKATASLAAVSYFSWKLAGATKGLTDEVGNLHRALAEGKVDLEKLENLYRGMPGLDASVTRTARTEINVTNNVQMDTGRLDDGMDDLKGMVGGQVRTLAGKVSGLERAVGVP